MPGIFSKTALLGLVLLGQFPPAAALPESSDFTRFVQIPVAASRPLPHTLDTLATAAQPRSALFDKEPGTPRSTLGSGWFWFGLYVLIALICGGLSGYAAVGKGLNPIPCFVAGFCCTIPGYLYVLTRPVNAQADEVPAGLVKVPATSAPVACPQCGYTNHPTAQKCLSCSASLQPTVQSEVARARQQASSQQSRAIDS